MKRLGIALLAAANLFSILGGCTVKELPIPVYEQASASPLTIDRLHPYSDEYLTTLREKYALDEKVAQAATDFDKVLAIAAWVTNLWDHDGVNEPAQGDPLFILDEVTENGQQFRCVEYGTVINGCLAALGIPSRGLALKTRDVETRKSGAGHVLCEVYLKDLNKWVFVDGQWGMIPTLDGVPLNGVEFIRALAAPERDALDLISLQPQNGKEDYYRWIREYLYFFDFTYWQEGEDGELVPQKVMLTPVGEKNPTIFQIDYTIDMDVYTHSVADFYPAVG